MRFLEKFRRQETPPPQLPAPDTVIRIGKESFRYLGTIVPPRSDECQGQFFPAIVGLSRSSQAAAELGCDVNPGLVTNVAEWNPTTGKYTLTEDRPWQTLAQLLKEQEQLQAREQYLIRKITGK
jgi:hypothetical protein